MPYHVYIIKVLILTLCFLMGLNNLSKQDSIQVN